MNYDFNNYHFDIRKTHHVIENKKINQILDTTRFLKKANKEIKDFINNEKDITKKAEFLKGVFNKEYTCVMVDDQMYGYKTFDNGILFWKDNFLSRDTESFVSWIDLTYHYDSIEFDYEYHVGDKFFMDADEYEILSIGINNVVLYDYQCPLFNKEMSKEEFDRNIKENPANIHLKVKLNTIEEQMKIEDEIEETNDEIEI